MNGGAVLGLLGAMSLGQTGVLGALGLIAVVTAIGVITHRNPIIGAFLLVAHLLTVAGLFVVLNAYFLAVIQVLVYAGAIMVLVLFVIMLLNLGRERRRGSGLVPSVGALGLGIALVWLLGKAAVTFAPQAGVDRAAWSEFGTVAALAAAMFGRYFYPFEVVALALTAAMIGAILLAKRDLED
jgi:NADH-quinone oxidoreductase subunit J